MVAKIRVVFLPALLVIMMLLLFSGDVRAETVIPVSIEKGSQYPWNKRVPVTVYVKSIHDAQKISVDWPVYTGAVISPQSRSISNVKKGQVYKFTFSFRPTVGKSYIDSSANVIITTADGSYVSNIRFYEYVNDKLVLKNAGSFYVVYLVLQYIFFILLILVILFIAFRIYKFLKDTFIKQWMEGKAS